MSKNQLLEHNHYFDNDDDVIAFSADSLVKLSKLKEVINSFIKSRLLKVMTDHFHHIGIRGEFINSFDVFKYGQNCEILQVGSNGWKKGKIRLKVSLEFIPDEPEIKEIESPLDDIRQSMNEP
ncbi:KGK domain-containing protein [Cyanothece sp. BG0011]|uniref:KGK domain-containing protein n=1 Tax=Cyanothece sp. BG0011 TaxID=2082950 RepID=UPI000D1E7E06|nr:KGK domain-containing protein [Cyanothece sp. BG0011]